MSESTVNPVDDPEFYCHGQSCLDSGCSPLYCKDNPDEWAVYCKDSQQ